MLSAEVAYFGYFGTLIFDIFLQKKLSSVGSKLKVSLLLLITVPYDFYEKRCFHRNVFRSSWFDFFQLQKRYFSLNVLTVSTLYDFR